MFSVPVSAAEPRCAGRVDLVGACFTVTGKLSLYDGTPSARISLPNGRMLGIEPFFEADNETFNAPETVRNDVDFNHSLKGAFLVCPLSKPRPKEMQSVCIESMQKP
jgi:hypothetical protein